jgi:hypothetical protein
VVIGRAAKHTRQGVRDLNGPHLDGGSYNGRLSTRSSRCAHNFCEMVVVGYRTIDDDISEEPVYGEKCGWCGEVRS